eukprot:TRINITY_DN10117_c0_g2_i1.p1 TRINITY_DN10117_c0_g2~~TRINITY_DN10117_c0_g2_i1.p1  ORF type:complete len:175 (+),score=19.81 TRINITY_DN10117_c0_g2_i1:44-568(+)
MPAFHSKFNDYECKSIAGISLLPINSQFSGPADIIESHDIIQEVLDNYRANVLFKTFNIEGNADRLLIYLTLFANQVLSIVDSHGKKCKECQSALSRLGQSETFFLPGTKSFPLSAMYPSLEAGQDSNLRAYLKQCRQTLIFRLNELLFNEDGTLNKWWMQFSKRQFLKTTLRG